MKKIWQSSAARGSDPLKTSRPALTLSVSSASRPGSWIGTIPDSSMRNFDASDSTHSTVLPISAKPAAATSPT
jgi:hypothetical protein